VALEEAEKNFSDESQSIQLRDDYFRTLLWCSDTMAGQKYAGKEILSEKSKFAELALTYLTLGKSEISSLSDGKRLNTYSYQFGVNNEFEFPIEISELLQSEDLEKLKESSNPFTLAQVGFCLAMQGDSSYLPALIAAWEADKTHNGYCRLLYLAVANLNESGQIDLIKKLYRQVQQEFSETEKQEFFAKLKTMTDPQVAEFLDLIQDENEDGDQR
ncbi:hypothetical protein N9153_03340, partial [Planctomicrobium sp.]|nr:hypothetical protein [Planctomicrobium sp.]